MTDNKINKDQVRDFWNSRANLGVAAGTQDVTLKNLEVEAISAFVHDGMRILDIGCGNGITATHLAEQYNVDVIGIDFAEEMVEAARTLSADRSLKGSVKFQQGDVQALSGLSDKFDIVYTERTLINLPDWESQQQAISRISSFLADEARYLMCEHSQDGLDRINSLRKQIGLAEIVPPWHNRYFREAELAQAKIQGVRLVDVIDFSSTYYFLSRVVNAWLAAQEGKEPDYGAPINKLSLELPPIGNLGQGKIWVWSNT